MDLTLPYGTSHNSGALQSSGNLSSLLVRHFPSWLGREEKESLLRHFGARDDVVMGTKGKLRNCAIVNFASEGEAKWALSKLHQLDVFGHRLTVEYTRPTHTRQLQSSDTDSWSCNKTRLHEEAETVEESVVKQTRELRSPLRAESPRYLYPPLTPTTLTNITNALTCVPQLYVQVLHLMNRMNLPPPFGDLTPTPPLLLQESIVQVPAASERVSDEEGSELSSEEDGTTKSAKPTHVPRHAPKRQTMSYQQVKSLLPSTKKRRIEGEPTTAQAKKIELNIPSEIVPRPELEAHTVTYITETETQRPPSNDSPHPESVDSNLQVESHQTASHTRLEPVSETSVDRSDDKEKSHREFITTEELEANRLSEKERKEYPVFSKYSPGESSMRLYIKNLGKHVTEKDLKQLYGRYVDWSSEKESNAFDIRLMQTGRMKGQAFIGLPSEEIAARALRETNGYLLHDKPMVVQFGRSTKAKETT